MAGTINPVFIPMHEEQIQRYGLSGRVVSVMGIETDPALMGRAFTEKRTLDAVLRQFRKQIEPMVKSGVEVIIPAGRLPSLLFSRIKNFLWRGTGAEWHRRAGQDVRNGNCVEPFRRDNRRPIGNRFRSPRTKHCGSSWTIDRAR